MESTLISNAADYSFFDHSTLEFCDVFDAGIGHDLAVLAGEEKLIDVSVALDNLREDYRSVRADRHFSPEEKAQILADITELALWLKDRKIEAISFSTPW